MARPKKPIKRRLPQQITQCDSCGAKFVKWDPVWARPDYSQIFCENCKETLMERLNNSPWFTPDELKGWFRKVPLWQCQF